MVDLRNIETACNMFKLDIGRWPDNLEELVNPPEDLENSIGGMYLKKMPTDPWGEPYYYEFTDRGVRLYSLGGDRTEGGDGVNMDLYSDE